MTGTDVICIRGSFDPHRCIRHDSSFPDNGRQSCNARLRAACQRWSVDPHWCDVHGASYPEDQDYCVAVLEPYLSDDAALTVLGYTQDDTDRPGAPDEPWDQDLDAALEDRLSGGMYR